MFGSVGGPEAVNPLAVIGNLGVLTCQSAGVFEAYQYWAEGECPIADMIMRLWKVFWEESL